ncbi:hypothetical protein D3C78_1147440 [compost metagenome]
MHDHRQCGEQRGEQGQGVQGQKRPAPWSQPLVVERVDDRNQRRDAQQPGENQLAAVPRRGDEEERQDKEQAFLMDHLRCVTQQGFWYFALEYAREQLGQAVFQHQPDPADQHDGGDPARQALLAIDQNETAHPGDETKERNDPRVPLHQIKDALYEKG